jgi:hypothetical protein
MPAPSGAEEPDGGAHEGGDHDGRQQQRRAPPDVREERRQRDGMPQPAPAIAEPTARWAAVAPSAFNPPLAPTAPMPAM